MAWCQVKHRGIFIFYFYFHRNTKYINLLIVWIHYLPHVSCAASYVQVTVFWVVTLYSDVAGYKCFRGP